MKKFKVVVWFPETKSWDEKIIIAECLSEAFMAAIQLKTWCLEEAGGVAITELADEVK